MNELIPNIVPFENEPIAALFSKQAWKTPENIAVVMGSTELSYQELNQKSNSLAKKLLNQFASSEIIGISATKNLEMVIGIIAILKAGKAYLPLDLTYPDDRIKQIISDSNIKACVAVDEERSAFEKFNLSVLTFKNLETTVEADVNIVSSPLACLLYTSGSTGKPKGVCLTQKGLSNFLECQIQLTHSAPGIKTLQFCHLSFDASFQEIFIPLISGGTLVLTNDNIRLDSHNLLNFIEEEAINRIFLPFVALQYLTEAAEASQKFPACLQEVITGGEILKITPQIAHFFSKLSACTLVNVYGPTETSIWVTELRLKDNADQWQTLPSIGKPVNNASVFIIDEELNLVADGTIGEIVISGIGLANGYLNSNELTAEKFVTWQHPQKGSITIYRTGDLAKYLPDGEIEFFGRKDNQVKIRGNRVEPAEIEIVLSKHKSVSQAVVIAREDIPGQKKLVAYLIASSSEKNADPLRKLIEEHLPDYMMPSAFIWLDEFPKTTSGKIDKKALPKPDNKRPDLQNAYKEPSTLIEKRIAENWTLLLQLDKVGIDDNFFELGGNSLLAQKTVAQLFQQFNYTIPITKLYQFTTVSKIASFIAGDKKETESIRSSKRVQHNTEVAIIGMSGHFPGANTIDDLWKIFIEEKETTHFFTTDELDPFISNEIKNNSNYVKARGIIEGAENFDASFFGITPKLAELMDPQQRIFLEIAWEALEKTGYVPQKYNGTVGIYAGAGNNTYYVNNVIPNKQLIENIGSFQVVSVNDKDYVSSRVAYSLNLKGPAVTVQSACSTSLLAIAQAVESIRKGQCDIALAGGVAINSPINSGHLYEEGAMYSKDGHTRSFDAESTGTVFSDGAGIVVLKSKEQALLDGDIIYAVIKGVGVSNDGGGKGSFTAPSAEGQAAAISMAIEDANIAPSSISYIETHGTATPLGDPIEIEGLNIAFGNQKDKQFCAIGSAKSNMGHLTIAAGVTGIIKTALSLYYKQIPASINYRNPNPNIDFKNSSFYVNTTLKKWESDKPRIAGVSSFGVGGTNVHIILEEAENAIQQTTTGRPLQLINWSAKTETSTNAYAGKLSEYFTTRNAELADVAYTLKKHRQDFNTRSFIIAGNKSEVLEKLNNTPLLTSNTKKIKESIGDIVFMFPGQGAQYLNMGKDLYEAEPIFKSSMDECAAILTAEIGDNILDIIYPVQITSAAEEKLKNTRYSQPALFTIGYSLAKLWMSWGIKPSIFIGHSIGEFVAAYFSGVFTLPDVLKLIAARGRLMSELPKGSMLSVRADVQKIQELLPPDISVAAINSPSLCVVAGTDDSIASFSNLLTAKEILNKPLHTSHAFHSHMMDVVIEPFTAVVKSISLNRPSIPIVSTVTGEILTDEQAIDPLYWAKHLRSTVLFAAAAKKILEKNNRAFLELGPGNVTSTLIRQQAAGKTVLILSSLEQTEQKQSEYYSILKSLGQLWINGVNPDWDVFYQQEKRKKIDSLPTYVFDKKRYWVNPPVQILSANINNTATVIEQVSIEHQNTVEIKPMRKNNLINKIKDILENISGIEMQGVTPDMSFIEMGLDSLLLTQIALNLKKEFNTSISFRQLNEQYSTLSSLADYLDNTLPPDVQNNSSAPVQQQPSVQNVQALPSGHGSAMDLINQQMQILAQQIALLQGNNVPPAVSIPASQSNKAPVNNSVSDITAEELIEIKKPFGATARIEKKSASLTDKQQKFLAEFIVRYTNKTKGSKDYTQKHRPYMADPRVVSGFRPTTKELVYSIVINKSKGSHIWDVDGNDYIDALNGFGTNLLGYQPDFIKKALLEQVEKGYEIGPQHELAGEVCKLICEFTNFDRAGLCNTGSEAVLGAMRIARTVTGRSIIVAFSGSYHGIIDEVIVRGTKKLKSFPAAPGIMPESVQNMLILDYGTEESLQIIKERAHEIAAVLVEPIQSRRPEFQPIEFLKKVRKITSDAGTALIFDEIISGFRFHPGGAQAMVGIKADIATYGKVIGGGFSIGVIAGNKNYMDALDGGFWQYGDNSTPEVGVTYFAGTFVRHPLALACAKASLLYLKEQGPSLQSALNDANEKLVKRLHKICVDQNTPMYVVHFGSLWKIKYKEEYLYSELFFTLMREKGIHILDGFPCFLTVAHTNADIEQIIQKFEESIIELKEAGFIPFYQHAIAETSPGNNGNTFSAPPVPNARLGKDKAGNPAWFIIDEKNPGKYVQITD